ncbi:MAG: transglutaminase domain-containing protein, partial [Anaerolineae bacterium]|nr:transglutaminase domain-containing protein [Anaerolineae bacterium]
MTVLSGRLPINRLGRRLAHGLRTLFAPGDGFALIVTLALLLTPLFSLTAAGWPLALNTVIPVVVISLGLGFLLARSHYNELFALVMGGLYGLGAVLLVSAINEPGDLAEGAVSMISRLVLWLNDAATGGINQDDLIFTMLVSALFWFLGYNAAWHIFRVDRVWRVILPPGLILISNTLYYTGAANLESFIFLFVFLALLLVVRSTLDARAWDWYVSGIRVPRSIQNHFFRVGIVLGLAALLIAGALPSSDIQERLNRFREFLQAEPLTQLSEVWNRLFSTVETQGPTTSDYYGGDSLQLGGAIRLGEQTVMLVQAPQGRRYYWRSRVLDTYASGRWTPGANVRLTVETSPLTVLYEPENLNARAPVQQQFTLALNASRLVYAAPQPYQVDLPTRSDLLYTPNRETMNISVIRPLRALRQGDSYTVTSLLTDASAAQLRAAPGLYPDWINRLYLQVPPSVTDRVRQLAQEIVTGANASTPYDRAKAIETWLRNNITYNET